MIKNSTLDKLKTIALSNVIKNLPLEKEKIIGVETSYKLSDLIK